MRSFKSLKMSTSVALILIVVLLCTRNGFAASSSCSNPPISSRRCGPSNGNAGCSGAQECCSQYGWCGQDTYPTGVYCNTQSLCLPGTAPAPTPVAAPTPTPVAAPTPSTSSGCSSPALASGQCGPRNGNAKCSGAQQCCSQYGWCGQDTYPTGVYCNTQSLCLPGTAPAPTPTPSPSTGIRALSSCGNNKKYVVLTFDDGPAEDNGFNLLAQLRAANVKGTFFLAPASTDTNSAALATRCSILKQQVADGHSVQLHSWTHPHFPALSASGVTSEITNSVNWVTQCAKIPKPRFFRPPYGELLPDQVTSISKDDGFIIAMWNVEPSDFANFTESAQVIRDRVVANFEANVGIGNSAIILLHEYFSASRPGLIQLLVDYFQTQHGYQFVTIDQCYDSCNSAICKSSRGGPTPYLNVYVP